MKNLIVLFALSFVFIGCDWHGKDGDTGPMGPQGLPGDAAQANNYYFVVGDADFTITPEGYVAYYDEKIDGITDGSIVLVYEKTENRSWRPLPYTEAIDTYDTATVDVSITHTFSVYDGGIRIEHITSLSFGYKFWREGSYRVVVL
jgi:hypothetical protein